MIERTWEMDSVEAIRRELSRYREAEVELAACRAQMQELNAMISGCGASGGAGDDASMKSYMSAKERVTDELERRIAGALSIRREVAMRIDAAQLPAEDKAIVEMRYLARMSWDDIADAVGYADARSVRRRARVILGRMCDE